jgi:hypothetical protein
MDLKEKELREQWIAAAVKDGYLDEEERRQLQGKAAEFGLGGRFDEILRDEMYKTKMFVVAQFCANDIQSYINKNYPRGKERGLTSGEKEEIRKYAKSLVPETNADPESSTNQLLSEVVDPLLERISDRKLPTWVWVLAASLVLIVAGVIGYQFLPKNGTGSTEPESLATNLTPKQKEQINALIQSMATNIEAGRYTDPPENCAKKDLDEIRNIDKNRTYKNDEIERQVSIVVDKYVAMARRDCSNRDLARKWLGRAKLFNRDSEKITDVERECGIKASEG